MNTTECGKKQSKNSLLLKLIMQGFIYPANHLNIAHCSKQQIANSKQKAQSAANNHACMSGSSTKISLPMPSDLLPTGIPPMYDIFGSVISPAKIDYLVPPQGTSTPLITSLKGIKGSSESYSFVSAGPVGRCGPRSASHSHCVSSGRKNERSKPTHPTLVIL